MNSSTGRSIGEIIADLRGILPLLRKKKILAGFDGFIDTIVKPVRKAGSDGRREFFRTIEEFGAFLAGHSHKSASIQYEIIQRKSGGNMVNYVKALDALGLYPLSIGMLSNEAGVREPFFENLGKQSYSYLACGTATVLEFDDGKIFLSALNIPGLDSNEKMIPRIENVFPEFKNAAASADLLALLNWSELPFAHNLWNDIYAECIQSTSADKSRLVFFDLCDTSAKTIREIEALVLLINRFGGNRRTILSLNRNEALDIHKKILGKDHPCEETAEFLRRHFALDELVIHQHTESAAVSSTEALVIEPCVLNKAPKISTGAGDHFNAAYCFASLAELPLAEKLIFANACSGSYVANGRSPGLD